MNGSDLYNNRVLNNILNLKDEMNERFSNAMKNNMILIVSTVTRGRLTWARHVTEGGRDGSFQKE